MKGVAVLFFTTEYRTPLRAWAYRPDTTRKKQGQVLQSALTQNSRLLVVAGDGKQASGGMPVWVYACVLGRHSTRKSRVQRDETTNATKVKSTPCFRGLLRPKATPLKRSSLHALAVDNSRPLTPVSVPPLLARWGGAASPPTRRERPAKPLAVLLAVYRFRFCCWGSR